MLGIWQANGRRIFGSLQVAAQGCFTLCCIAYELPGGNSNESFQKMQQQNRIKQSCAKLVGTTTLTAGAPFERTLVQKYSPLGLSLANALEELKWRRFSWILLIWMSSKINKRLSLLLGCTARRRKDQAFSERWGINVQGHRSLTVEGAWRIPCNPNQRKDVIVLCKDSVKTSWEGHPPFLSRLLPPK